MTNPELNKNYQYICQLFDRKFSEYQGIQCLIVSELLSHGYRPVDLLPLVLTGRTTARIIILSDFSKLAELTRNTDPGSAG